MKPTILFKPCGIGNFECLQLNDDGSEFFVADSERLIEAAESSLVFIAPADSASLRRFNFAAHEKKLLRKTIPYSLEEELVDSVDELHFALGPISDNSVPLVIVNRLSLEQWLESFRQQNLDVSQVISELQLLPVQEKNWSLLIDQNQWVLRFSDSEGFVIDAENASLALQLLLDESEEIPSSLDVYSKEDERPTITQQIPELLKNSLEWHEVNYWQLIGEGYKQQTNSVINLLQGDFALSLPWQKWWKSWRIVAGLFLFAITAQLLTGFVQLQVLEDRNVKLRAEIEKVYRSAIPKGAIMDPERQLRRKVNNLKGRTGDGFIVLLDTVGSELAKINGLVLQSLNFTDKQTEIRLTLLANTFDDVETVRLALEQQGLKAELTGSNADGNKTRARLRIRG